MRDHDACGDGFTPRAAAFTFLAATMLLTGAGCATATPVTPAPASPDEVSKIQAALVGTCDVTATQTADGSMKEAKGLTITFSPDGKIKWDIPGGMSFGNAGTYRLDGRNIEADVLYKHMRVDDYSGKTLKLFLYDITQTYYCSRR